MRYVYLVEPKHLANAMQALALIGLTAEYEKKIVTYTCMLTITIRLRLSGSPKNLEETSLLTLYGEVVQIPGASNVLDSNQAAGV